MTPRQRSQEDRGPAADIEPETESRDQTGSHSGTADLPVAGKELEDSAHLAKRARVWIHLALIALAVAFTFSNTLDNGLYLDDAFRVKDNPGVLEFWPPWRHFVDYRTNASLPQIAEFRPMVPLSLSVDVAVADLLGVKRLAAHHVANIVFHFLNCVLFYFLFRELFLYWSGPRPPTRRWLDVVFAAVFLFAIHPISGVTINYVGARNVQLMLLFLLGSLLIYIRMRRRGWSISGWALSLILLGLSISSKQNAAVAPGLIFTFEYFLGGQALRSWRTWVRPLPFAGVIAGFLAWSNVVYHKAQIRPEDVGEPLVWTATQLRLHVFYYLRNIFWPFRMRMLPDVGTSENFLEPAVATGVLFMATTVALAFFLRRRAPIVSWSIAAYWILFAPSSLIAFRPMTYYATDYRQYGSLAFFFLIFALAGSRIPTKRIVAAAAMALVAYFGVSAFAMNRIWRTEESAWGQSVKYGARSIGEMNYGLAVQARDPALAEKHYKEALRKSANNTYAMINLGLVYLRTGRVDQGIAMVERALANAPSWALTHFWLGYAYDLAGREADARAMRRIAADLDPRNIAYQYEAGVDLKDEGQLERSLVYLQRVTAYDPTYREALFLEGFALQKTGQWKQAEAKYRQLLEFQPRQHRAWFNLGHGLMEEGRHRQAIEAFNMVLSINAGLVRPSHWWLGTCYEALGDSSAAARHKGLYETMSQ